ncbi:hypothetical protein [Nocardia wallacei]|nr:hypothetical protein [Nocardia wallacei]
MSEPSAQPATHTSKPSARKVESNERPAQRATRTVEPSGSEVEA